MSDDAERKYHRALEFSGLGIQLAVTISAGVLGGLWLDNHYGTSPLFILLGSFGALAAVFYQMFRIAGRLS